jgi:hypothetical protein
MLSGMDGSSLDESDMNDLEGGTGEEAKLHCESQGSGKDEGQSGPWEGGAETLSERFDQKEDEIENKHENEAVRNEDAGAGGSGSEHMFDMKRREKGADSEDDQEKNELQ